MARATRPENENNSGGASFSLFALFLAFLVRFNQLNLYLLNPNLLSKSLKDSVKDSVKSESQNKEYVPPLENKVAARVGKEIHGHRRESILLKEKLSVHF
jgi:hypothetical protein